MRLFGKPVCARAFASAHGETTRTFSRRKAIVDTAVGDHVSHRVAFRPRQHRLGLRREDCSDWLRDTLSSMAQPLPNKTVRGPGGEERTREFLPTGMFSTLNDVYQYYCGHVLSQPDSDGVETRPASFQTFRRAWVTNYFQVSLHPAVLPTRTCTTNWAFPARSLKYKPLRWCPLLLTLQGEGGCSLLAADAQESTSPVWGFRLVSL